MRYVLQGIFRFFIIIKDDYCRYAFSNNTRKTDAPAYHVGMVDGRELSSHGCAGGWHPFPLVQRSPLDTRYILTRCALVM